MWLLGFTLNMMTLLALALAVGIVIDDAIVVLENIVRFIEEKGLEPMPAAVAATKDIGLAVLATTLSLLAVFIPVSFMTGIVGRFLKGFGLTMASAILVSLFVSFTLTPMLSARWLRAKKRDTEGTAASEPPPKSRLERLVDVFYRPIERAYLSLLRRSMAKRWMVVVLCCVALGSCVPLTIAVPKSFTPEDDNAQFSVNLRAPEGSTVQATRIVADRIARDIRKVPGVQHTLVTIGDSAQMQPNRASIYVKLVDPKDRRLSQRQLMDKVRHDVLAKLPPELFVAAAEVSDFGGSSAKVQYTLSGPDLNKLAHYTDTILKRLRQVPGAVDVDSTLVVGKPEVRVLVDRDRAQNLGVEVSDIASTLQLLVGGLKVSTYSERGEDYDIRARAKREYRMDERGFLITVPSRTAKSVPIDSVVRAVPNTGASQIDRLNRQRQVTITCNAAPGYGESQIASALVGIIDDLHLPAGYKATPAGGSRETGKATLAFAMAFAASFIFMYLVLAAQFESWIHPVTILVSLPLTAPFALLSLLIFGQQITIFSALGLLVLFGVVKKNAILQVDHTNHLRAEGKSRADAIIEANRDRLRPILMTTIAFVAGMLPLLFSRGIGAGLNRGIAGVIVGGQTLSLVLTLLATPVLYSLFDDLAEKLRERRERRQERREARRLSKA
jgi:multidrug efflux pump subunit AcrB